MKEKALRERIKQARRTSGCIAASGVILLLVCLYEPTASLVSVRSSFLFSLLISIVSGAFCYFFLFLYLLKQNISADEFQKIIQCSHTTSFNSMNNNHRSSSIQVPLHRNNDWYNNPGNPASPSYIGRFTNHRY